MPRKTKKGNNPFFFFMLDWKEEQEQNGRTFPGGLQDVSRDPLINEAWKNLSKPDKAYYESKAKDSKIEAQGSMGKKTALGESIDEVMAAEKREIEFHQNMLQYIDSVIAIGTQHNNLEKIKFIFIHVNWFYKREMGINKYKFVPAELAVAEFSLENGVENVYHEIINAKIDLGFRRDAIETSMETHKIPIQIPEGQDDFTVMYNKLTEILRANMTGTRFPPLFVAKDLTPAVKSLLEQMAEASKESANDFIVYSLEALFGALRNAAATKVDDVSIPLVVAEHEFGKDAFCSVRNLECDYHKNIDGTSQYCSMAIVKRWGFTICDYCCEYLGMDLIPGIHCPIPLETLPTFNNQDTLDTRLNSLTIKDQCKVVSMTGVSDEHRMKVSGRTYQEEQRRRNECKPLVIIDHSVSNNAVNTSGIPGRPLRPPKSVARALTEMQAENGLFNATDFPPIGGRGIVMKKEPRDAKFPPLGKGRGKC
ncbi:protein maelstrom homolog isoform X1 [Andrena cerasifolii]|uniref:protein maelstrom homolog isoform X1 n=1 Tax=Andrena cerasifolii TaxID=2819439 RepID=UPI00403846AB